MVTSALHNRVQFICAVKCERLRPLEAAHLSAGGKKLLDRNHMDTVETRTIAKVSRRLVPFLILCYFVAYLDRVNVGFAALTMNQTPKTLGHFLFCKKPSLNSSAVGEMNQTTLGYVISSRA